MLQSKHYKLLPAILLVVLQLAAASLAAASTPPLLPTLNWQQRSDWVNVKHDVSPAAVGDGIHDDTAAIQAALNLLDDNYVSRRKAVYFPPGTYRITKTLVLNQNQGTLIVGHGQATRILWGGALNQTMFLSKGATYPRYIGLIWDGANKAAVGVDHASKSNYETNVRHQDEEFINFRNAGVRVGYNQVATTAEMMFRNCLFQNCNNGVAFLEWNDYANDFEGCDFRDCGIAINCQRGNVYVRDSHFERSTTEDISLCPHTHSVRRCTSVGSRQFVSVAQGGFADQVTVQDCHVDGWTGPQGAMAFGMSGPTTVFDCSFTHAPDASAPIRLTNPSYSQQLVTLSNNTTSGAASLVDPGINSSIVNVPAGTRGPSLSDPTQTLFISSEAVPSAVLDVKAQFGAKGDGVTDDTAAILAAIHAAVLSGGNTVVYLPAGRYNVSATLPITGAAYSIAGSGRQTVIQWTGSPTGGPIFSVQDPQNISVEQMQIVAPDAVACIRQTSTSTAPSSITYDGLDVGGSWLSGITGGPSGHVDMTRANRGLECVALPASAIVHLGEFNGSAHYTDCSRATILQEFGGGGVLQVDGGDYEKSGFLGMLCNINSGNPCDIVIRDNQDFVGTNMYTEQTESLLRVSGDGSYLGQPGHVTVQGYCHTYASQVITINDYEGRVTAAGMFFTKGLYDANPVGISVLQTGSRPADIVLLNNICWMNAPVTQSDPGTKLMVLQNLVNTNDGSRTTYSIPDLLPGLGAAATMTMLQSGPSPLMGAGGSGALADAAAAFDDFRQLGAVDLAINHP